MKNRPPRAQKIFVSFILFLSAIILALLIAEGLLRLFYPLIANYDLEMYRYAAYAKLPSDIPGISHRHRPGAHFRNLYGVEVKINSKGLRDYEYGYQKPKNCYRILALGDSITFGWGVPFLDTYPKLLEKKLNGLNDGIRYEVIDAGVGNYQLKDELSFLKSEGLKYNPDMIILGYFIDDARINNKIQYYGLKSHSYLYAFLASKWNMLKIKTDPRYNFINYYTQLYDENSKTRVNLEANIDELKMVVKKKNIPLLVMLIPDLHDLKNYNFREIHKYVSHRFGEPKDIDIRVLDLLSYFDKNVNPHIYWVSSEDSHHNYRAQRIMADALYPEVIRLKDIKKYNLSTNNIKYRDIRE